MSWSSESSDARVSWGPAALALALALALQSAFAPLLAFRGAVPSLVLVLVTFVAVRAGPAGGLVFGTLAGAGEDALAATGAGWTIATALVGVLAGTTAGSSVNYDRRAFTAAVVVATVLRYVVFAFVLQIEHRPLPALHPLLWQSCENALIGLLAMLRAERPREKHGYTR